MRVNSLYSYPYLNYQKPLVLPIIAYMLSSTKLEIRAKQFLPGSEGVGGEREGPGNMGEPCLGHPGHHRTSILCIVRSSR
jgi:hypothetical protein